MDKLTTEQKAERYVQALERARIWKEMSGMPKDKQGILDNIFPELNVSEDERIRQEIIDYLSTVDDKELIPYESWIAWLEKQVTPQDKGEISDGYHTFNELYYYRMLYNAAFFNMLPKEWVHKSKKHHDGEDCFGGGWFIVMANLPTGQVSNHYELKDWDLFQIPEKEVADKWDGHTPQEAADRLRKYLLEKQGDQATTKKFSTSEVIDIERQALRECKSFSDIVAADKYAAEAVATVDDFIKKQSEQNSAWSEEDEKIRKMLIKFFGNGAFFDSSTNGIPDKDIVAWLEKQNNNPYNGVSFEYNGNTWGMCARDNGVDILLNRELIQHVSIEKQGEQNPIMAKSPQLGEQKPAWSEED